VHWSQNGGPVRPEVKDRDLRKARAAVHVQAQLLDMVTEDRDHVLRRMERLRYWHERAVRCAHVLRDEVQHLRQERAVLCQIIDELRGMKAEIVNQEFADDPMVRTAYGIQVGRRKERLWELVDKWEVDYGRERPIGLQRHDR